MKRQSRIGSARPFHLFLVLFAALSCARPALSPDAIAPEPGEYHLRNIRRLAHGDDLGGGYNGAAHFSPDGTRLIFEGRREHSRCEQIYLMNVDGSDIVHLAFMGHAVDGSFHPSGDRVIFSSSFAMFGECPSPWKQLDQLDIYSARPDGSDVKRLTKYGIYTGECAVSPDGTRIVFTSRKDGDLDIYTMRMDGSDIRRLTATPGYDGRPQWSPDGSQIAYEAWHPIGSALRAYRDLLVAEDEVSLQQSELWVMNADGSGQRQITHLGGENFTPSWTPDGRRLIFSSSHQAKDADLFLVNLDGTGVEQVTTHESFDGSPVFSPDGRLLVWTGKRRERPDESSIYIATWKD
jgi:TolB protein